MSNLLQETFPPAPGGMNVAMPQQEIDDTEARYIQDALLNNPGLMIRRGPVQAQTGMAKLPRPSSGLGITINPKGSARYASLSGDKANGYFTVWSDDLSAVTDIPWPFALPFNPTHAGESYHLADIKPALGGGAWVGTASDYTSNSPKQGLARWRGANRADYTTGTITVARGSASVSGSGTAWNANAVPGMFLFANTDDPLTNVLIGTVLSVNSDTSITLEHASPYAGTAKAYTLTSIRGFQPKVTKGRVTCDTASTTVTGGETKFVDQGLGSGVWNLYRASDLAWIGKVSVVNSNTSITLAANAAVSVIDDSYVALRGDWAAADTSISVTGSANKVGWLTALYAERQWYANNGAQFDKTYRVWFSDENEPEAVDLSDDGDWLPVSSTSNIPEPIRAIVPTFNALLVLKENESFAIYGTSPTSFSDKKLEDDGTLSTMSVQPFAGGAIWAGKQGIHFYDGVQVQNLTDGKLGDVWRNSIRSVDPLTYRMWSMMVRNHYFLFVESLSPSIGVVKGNTTSTPTSWVVVVNMETRAITMATNVHLRGAIQLPAQTGRSVWYVVNENVGSQLVKDPEKVAWSFTNGSQPAPVIDTTVGYFGTSSLKVTTAGVSGDGIGSFSAASAAGSPATAYKVSAMINHPAGKNLQVWVDEYQGITYLRSTNTGNIVGTGDWQRVSLSLTTGANTDTLVIRVIQSVPADGAFTFWLDGPALNASASFRDYWAGTVCDAGTLFDAEGVDTLTCVNATAGPDFFFESKKYNAGDDLRLKRFKQLAVHYLAQGGDIKLDTVIGLNNVGETQTTVFPASVYTWDVLRTVTPTWNNVKAQFPTWNDLVQGVFKPARARFLKKSQHLSFRLYQSNSTMSRARIGPFSLDYKLMRVGRVS